MAVNLAKEIYTLHVGQQGKERLDIQNEIYNPSTQQFLLSHGLKKGMRVLEVGCGTGELACWLAMVVGPEGCVLAIDNSEEQLAVSKHLAKEKGLTNIQFKHMSIYDLENLTGFFDLAFSRWVIAHLLEPLAGLRAMYSRLKIDGVLINELAHLDSVFIYPKQEVGIRFNQIYSQALKYHGKDIELAYKIPNLLLSCGSCVTKTKLFQPLARTSREKLLLSMTLAEAKDFILQSKVVTSDEIEKIIAELKLIAYAEDISIGLSRSIQIASIKIGKEMI